MQTALALRFESAASVWGVKEQGLYVVGGEEMIVGNTENDLLVTVGYLE